MRVQQHRGLVTIDATIIELDADQHLERRHGQWYLVLDPDRGPQVTIGPLAYGATVELDKLLAHLQERQRGG